jgi:tyrosyl-tRNA synthetase
MADTKKEKIKELLERGVDEVIEKEHLKKRLIKGDKLRVKFGIDPTGSELHLGHLVPFRKLKQFQNLGHQVIFLIGDYTAKIGDPTGRSETRKMLTDEDIKNNMKDYIDQASKVLKMDEVEIRYNSEWYDKKGPAFMMELTSKFTFARMIERDDFKKRIKEYIDVSMVELLYPLLQGYDSVELRADVELGGRDQKFNLLTGRKAQRRYNQSEQDIITVPLLEGLDGVKKMSKSYGNYIAFNDSASDMFGKIMSLPDNLLWKYFKLLTDILEEEISKTEEKVRLNEVNPRDVKIDLAKEIIKIFYSEKEASEAQENFINVFQKKENPEDIKEFKIKEDKKKLIDIISEAGLTSSKGEARRLIEQGAVKIDSKVENKWDKEVKIKDGTIIQAGKRKFIKITK